MVRSDRKTGGNPPAPSAREAALIEVAWHAVTSAQVLVRGFDPETGVRAIVQMAGASWVHGEETTARLQRIFPGLPEREQRLMIRHINARINARAVERGVSTGRKRWATGWMDESHSGENFTF